MICSLTQTCHYLEQLRQLLALAFCIIAFDGGNLFAQKAISSRAPGLQSPSEGWQVLREIELPAEPLSQFSKKLNVPLSGLFNTFVQFEQKELQINTLTAQSATDAERLRTILAKSKSNPRWVVRNDQQVYEFVIRRPEDALLAAQARYAFDIQPVQAAYRIEFDALPIAPEGANVGVDDRNRLFNLLLNFKPDAAPGPEIAELAKRFPFTDRVALTSGLESAVTLKWSTKNGNMHPNPSNSQSLILKITSTETKANLRTIHLTADIHIDASKQRSAPAQLDRAAYLSNNKRFPVDNAELTRAVQSIIQRSESEEVKLRKLLAWFVDSKNIRYDGLTGSRYGTLRAWEQHYGRCWDYSDLFVTMARIAGLPCRQVYGWLYQSEGHVWCDVLVDGNWRMVDPTTGARCGSDYLPLHVSETGEFPMIYASAVSISEARP